MPGPSDHLSDLYFADLPLPAPVRAGISACGFVRATPVQAATLPLLLQGKDVAAQAQTGTGKTAAFLISIFAKLCEPPRSPHRPAGAPRALIVAPTRELAIQIREDADKLGQFVAPRMVTVFGGLDYVRQREQLRAGCDVLIGTPGRLLDYEQQGAVSFGHVESLVIDEADRLFDLGFIKDLRRILRRCPPPARRHSMLFSATLSWRVMELSWEHMNDTEKVAIEPEKMTVDRVEQVLYHVGTREKIPLLLGLLRREGATRTMLFVNTKRYAERLVNALERAGMKVGAISGDLPQARRMKILADFKAGRLPLLVATDVASRGLHVEGVTHVVNIDLPQDPEDYVHRIGRTARAGATGKAISLACEQYVMSLDSIERLIGRKIPVAFADDELFKPAPPAPRPAPTPVPLASGGSRHIAPDASAKGASLVRVIAEAEAADEAETEAEPTGAESETRLPSAVEAPPVAPPPARPPAPAKAATAAPAKPAAAVAAAPPLAAGTSGPPTSVAAPGRPGPTDADGGDAGYGFWTREAFGMEPAGPDSGTADGSGEAEAGAEGLHEAGPGPGPAARRRRRRRRRPAGPSGAAPDPAPGG